MDSAVVIKIDNFHKITAVRKNTDCPYYNEYFVFEFYTTLEYILEKNITISVIEPSNIWRKRKTLGYITLDIATIWQQKNHQFYHKWAILSTPKTEVYSGPRGYLKLDISLLAKGEMPKVPTNIINDDIEGNLLLPQGKFTERQKAKYIFDIFLCKNLIDKYSNIFKDENQEELNTKGLSTFVEISFAGVSARTSVQKKTLSPKFNERLIIIDLFPPLCQTIKIELCYGDAIRKSVHSQKQISLKHISNDKDEGFLPTLGPVFLHLNSTQPPNSFAGTILMAINTEVDDNIFSDTKKGTKSESISPINESKYFETEAVALFTFIYEISAISKKYSKKPVSFRTTFGCIFVQKRKSDSLDNNPLNWTPGITPKKVSKNYYYLDFGDEKPCLWIFRDVPYFKKRVYNSNILYKVSQGMKTKLDRIEELFDTTNPRETSSLITQQLEDLIDFIVAAGKKYIDIINSYSVQYNTKLDTERKKLCLQEMENILKRAKIVQGKYSNKKTFRKLRKMYLRIEILIEDVQDCWPDIIIWMMHGKKHVAHTQIRARDLLFSPVDEERGQYCGVQRTIYFYDNVTDKRHLAAKMEMKMYLCLDRHKSAYIQEMPTGVDFENTEDMPRCLVSKNKKKYELRCYIFQGKIIAGFDKSALCDPLVRLLVQNHVKETQVIEKSLNPIWDETLVFSDIIIDEFYISSVLMEIYDKDEMSTFEFVGRTTINPKISASTRPNESIKLEWFKAYSNEEVAGEVLGAFEYIEISEETDLPNLELPHTGKIINIPKSIKPELVSYKVEVLFWGMRNLGKINLIGIKRPRITILCGDNCLHSDTIENASKNPNFTNKIKSMTLVFPIQQEYAPPLRLKMYDSRRFGVYLYAGIHISQISSFLMKPISLEERRRRLSKISIQSEDTFGSSSMSLPKVGSVFLKIPVDLHSEDIEQNRQLCFLSRICRIFGCGKSAPKKEKQKRSPSVVYEPLNVEEQFDMEDYDWWTKFYASTENTQSAKVTPVNKIRTLKIYEAELESESEFKGFKDMLTSFEIFKGKRTGDDVIDEEHITGIFKGSIKIYQWPLESTEKFVLKNGCSLEDGVFQNYPENTPLSYILRVYCVRALGLMPKDLSGKSDPYIIVKLNKKIYNERKNYIAGNVNPIFGRCFEFNGTFPQEYLLKVSVWDYDSTTSDDLIGETEIDLENRYYSRHMAFCGIADTYEESGYCAWRGQYKPTTILSDLCKKLHIDSPVYGSTSVKVGIKEFTANHFASGGDSNLDKELLALTALRRWKEMPIVGFSLVPEHVETRSLFHPTKPGIEQGKLQLWIDMFPVTDLPPPKQVDITIRKPISYQLRVIIWNTSEVVLDEDDFFSGERKSDIYVKGWLTDGVRAQFTDVHYRSLTGEGNFNWRFIFNFNYLATENKMVIKKKENLLSSEEIETKIPCKLTLQIWDNDTFSKDDFIGTLSLELAKLKRPAKSAQKCSLNILDKQAPTVNLFKIRRTKGWWPFKEMEKSDRCTGKIEAELELLTSEEAEAEPAGLGRRKPQELPPPNRPDTSFSWLKNPWKGFKYLVCKVYKWRCICGVLLILIIIMIVTTIYSVPGYAIRAFLHI